MIITQEQAEEICENLNIFKTDTNIAQLLVMLEALKLFDDRNERYQDAFKINGWRGNLVLLRQKVERLWFMYWHKNEDKPDDLDDALDCINFATFFIRSAKQGNQHGQWNWSIRS